MFTILLALAPCEYEPNHCWKIDIAEYAFYYSEMLNGPTHYRPRYFKDYYPATIISECEVEAPTCGEFQQGTYPLPHFSYCQIRCENTNFFCYEIIDRYINEWYLDLDNDFDVDLMDFAEFQNGHFK